MTQENPRFLHVPQTEQEVVSLFSIILDDITEFPQPVTIERIQTGFPDCILRAGGTLRRVEFELYGSSFNHPYDGCDVVVCWRDDRNDWPASIEVIQLAEVLARSKRKMFIHPDEGYPAPWNFQTFVAAAEREGIDARNLALVRGVVQLAEEYGMGPMWLVSPRPTFAVGSPQYFKVTGDGRIGFPFSRLGAEHVFPQLAERLNQVAPPLALSAADTRTKSKGGQLADLLQEDQLRPES